MPRPTLADRDAGVRPADGWQDPTRPARARAQLTLDLVREHVGAGELGVPPRGDRPVKIVLGARPEVAMEVGHPALPAVAEGLIVLVTVADEDVVRRRR
jgi:hypothetical protein